MAIVYQSKSEVFGTGTSPVLTEPTGTASGDFLLAVIDIDAAAASIATPSGWTDAIAANSTTPAFRYKICWRIRFSALSTAELTFTHAGSTYREVSIHRFSGTDQSSPIELFQNGGNYTQTNSSTSKMDPPSATAVNGTMAVAGGVVWSGSIGGFTPPAGYTLRSDNTAGNDLAVATKSVTAGAENPAAFVSGTTSGTSDGWSFTMILQTPQGGATFKPATPGMFDPDTRQEAWF